MPTLEVLLTMLDKWVGSVKSLTRYVEAWDGMSQLRSRESGILGFDHAILGSLDILEPMEWLDTAYCGRPYVKFLVGAASYGYMDIRVKIEYGQLETLVDKGISIIPIRDQDHIFAETVQYAPEVQIFVADIEPDHGRFFRVKSIENKGDIGVNITAKYPSTLKIRPEGVYDYIPVTMEAF